MEKASQGSGGHPEVDAHGPNCNSGKQLFPSPLRRKQAQRGGVCKCSGTEEKEWPLPWAMSPGKSDSSLECIQAQRKGNSFSHCPVHLPHSCFCSLALTLSPSSVPRALSWLPPHSWLMFIWRLRHRRGREGAPPNPGPQPSSSC